ncbi:hypothetical protein RGR602_CH04036 [Rhizobium gallicum bv. gallicum R602sp]|uniref:Uncharacterized protein n=1 Tax=Rhizobium gallicum bv. gallicum R602sp TaxID=1041138 RepID=A0A0B4X9W6_9HYPH|nr:hypothetical protein RGR602_CH04036 [Rhizobium gallicum bv. gallicum R602sp]
MKSDNYFGLIAANAVRSDENPAEDMLLEGAREYEGARSCAPVCASTIDKRLPGFREPL